MTEIVVHTTGIEPSRRRTKREAEDTPAVVIYGRAASLALALHDDRASEALAELRYRLTEQGYRIVESIPVDVLPAWAAEGTQRQAIVAARKILEARAP